MEHTTTDEPAPVRDDGLVNWTILAFDKHGFRHEFTVQADTRDTANMRAGIVAATIPYFSASTARVADVQPIPDELVPLFRHV